MRSVYSASSNQMKYSLYGRPNAYITQRGMSTDTNEQEVTMTRLS